MSTPVDFTQKRKGSKAHGRIVDVCPKCGRKGQKTIYDPRNGKEMTNYVHKGYIDDIFGFMHVTEHCTVVVDAVKAEG